MKINAIFGCVFLTIDMADQRPAVVSLASVHVALSVASTKHAFREGVLIQPVTQGVTQEGHHGCLQTPRHRYGDGKMQNMPGYSVWVSRACHDFF